MTPFLFVHTADLHLDSPFHGIQTVNPGIAEALRESTFKAFSQIIDFCVEREVDFILIAGDVYDGADRSLKAQIRFRDELKRLCDAGISAYVIHGNHDPLDGWRAKLDWPRNIHIFDATIGRAAFAKAGEIIASIYGTSYPRREVRENLSLRYQKQLDDVYTIGILHANVGENSNHESYAPCSLRDLQGAGFDYWALGHIHKHHILQDQAPTVVYPGNPQGRHPGEGGTHGCVLVQVDENGQNTLEFVPTDTIRWLEQEISIEGLDGEEDLLQVIEESIQTQQEQEGGRHLIGRIQLVGRGPLHRSLSSEKLVDVLETVRERFNRDDPFVWIDQIRGNTRPEIDIAARRQSQDFTGDFLRIVDLYRTDPEKRQTLRNHLEPLLSHRLGRKYLETISDAQLLDILEKAHIQCLDLLLENDP